MIDQPPTLFDQPPDDGDNGNGSGGSSDYPNRPPAGEICPCCGFKVPKLNPHHVDSVKAGLLLRMRTLADRGFEWIHVGEHGRSHPDVPVIETDDAHIHRLKWFGLAETVRRSGVYRITQKGRAFLAGRATVPHTILCLKGDVVDTEGPPVTIRDVQGFKEDRSYWDNYFREQRTW